jgi:hypothetical protein
VYSKFEFISASLVQVRTVARLRVGGGKVYHIYLVPPGRIHLLKWGTRGSQVQAPSELPKVFLSYTVWTHTLIIPNLEIKVTVPLCLSMLPWRRMGSGGEASCILDLCSRYRYRDIHAPATLPGGYENPTAGPDAAEKKCAVPEIGPQLPAPLSSDPPNRSRI